MPPFGRAGSGARTLERECLRDVGRSAIVGRDRGDEGAAMDADWARQVLRFWFEELTPDDWYSQTPEPIDQAIRRRFERLYQEVAAGPPAAAWNEQGAALAAVIVLDQFPRNMFRGKARAFATDTLAVSLARNALDKGLDAALPGARRRFLFMPLMHSEILADQEHCVVLFQAVAELKDDVKYAEEHRDIVARFGRFPHRNRVLERESTGAERAFLREHKGFGQ